MARRKRQIAIFHDRPLVKKCLTKDLMRKFFCLAFTQYFYHTRYSHTAIFDKSNMAIMIIDNAYDETHI